MKYTRKISAFEWWENLSNDNKNELCREVFPKSYSSESVDNITVGQIMDAHREYNKRSTND